MKQRRTWYELVRNLPVARFYYQGDHSHPVRRTVLIIESRRRHILGYELRCGNKVMDISEAPVKKYLRGEIATHAQLGARKHRIPGPPLTTLSREPLTDIFLAGV